jgi:hypothetical protein
LAAAEDPPVLTHAVIVLTAPDGPILSMAERERLWRAFHVPVFEQIVGSHGELLAAECEAHDGLHVQIAELPWDGFCLEISACGCGRKTPRITPLETAERVRSAAAYAR